MNLAILHYHLNRGGVTRVIANQLLAIDAARLADAAAGQLKVAVVYGGRRQGWDDSLAERLRTVRLQLVEVSGLDYDDAHHAETTGDPDHLAHRIRAELDRLGFQTNGTLLQFHNHALGKNVAMPGLVHRLADAGYGVLLQIHDFAEDMRPRNYARLVDALEQHHGQATRALYPQATHIHYAVLNGRDRRILAAAGVANERLHLLPNPVDQSADGPSRGACRRKLTERFGIAAHQHLIVYPVRGIRRKNLGEALLYAALAPSETCIGITLAPLNPVEQAAYEAWKEVAERLRLPVVFELGGEDGLSFEENMASADAILSTSIAEGFGMAFLESWLTGRPLLGRDLPEITEDFVAAGVRLPWSHEALWIPAAWIDRPRFIQKTIRSYLTMVAGYGGIKQKIDETAVLDEKFRAKPDPASEPADGDAPPVEVVDFGQLDEANQRAVLEKAATEEAAREAVRRLNPWFAEAIAVDPDHAASVIRHNGQVIENHYSFAASGQRLLALLRQVADSPRQPATDPLPTADRILSEFLQLRHFRLLLA